MFPTSQQFPPMGYTDRNLQNQMPWQQPEHYAPNTIQTQLPYQLPQHYQSQQLSFSQQPGSQNFSINNILKPPKLNLIQWLKTTKYKLILVIMSMKPTM
jgi:hypothetical protein